MDKIKRKKRKSKHASSHFQKKLVSESESLHDACDLVLNHSQKKFLVEQNALLNSQLTADIGDIVVGEKSSLDLVECCCDRNSLL